ncbi:MAG: UDP-3-O-(3-hydroxymyristoyl)glucosamine N-acyltransferase [Gemmatimonadota bacterium]|nr:UDP-3-O-(3-hydroxymyristoyl)glucosamine N-acyltransferase [Gemmatimonadota bacterium]
MPDHAGVGEGSRSRSSLTAADIAHLVGGRLIGDGGVRVFSVAPLDRAGEQDLSFLASSRYSGLFSASAAGAALVAPALAEIDGGPAVRIVVEQPYEAVLRVLPALYPERPRRSGIHSSTVLGRGVTIGQDVFIGPHVTIGDGAALGDRVWIDGGCDVGAGVGVGADSRLHAAVTLYPGTTIGLRVRVHAGARIGSDGFGYVFMDGSHQKIPHVGRCLIGDDVEIGANSCIDRGSVDDTVVGAGTKIDNLVHIAHNVRIGRLCLIVAQAGIAGSARLEDGCVIGGQAGLNGHIAIGARARVAGQSGVFGDVPAGESWSGYPARPHAEALRTQAALSRLARIARALERLVHPSPPPPPLE